MQDSLGDISKVVGSVGSGASPVIGKANGWQLFGIVDNVRIYDESLFSSQIKQNYIVGLNSMLSNGNISKQEYNERISNLAYDK